MTGGEITGDERGRELREERECVCVREREKVRVSDCVCVSK
jgi:hypothetical protein